MQFYNDFWKHIQRSSNGVIDCPCWYQTVHSNRRWPDKSFYSTLCDPKWLSCSYTQHLVSSSYSAIMNAKLWKNIEKRCFTKILYTKILTKFTFITLTIFWATTLFSTYLLNLLTDFNPCGQPIHIMLC